MQEICLLNPINSRQAFSAATSCVITTLVVNASDVDHVLAVYVPPLANMGDKHRSLYSLSTTPEPLLHAKMQTMANGKQKHSQAICHQVSVSICPICSREASFRDNFGF